MVFIQFTISVFLLISVLVVYSQLLYLKNVPLGFNPQNVVGIYGFNRDMSRSYKAIEAELVKLPYIENIGSSKHFMGGGASGQYLHEFGKTEGKGHQVNEYRILHGFCETLEMQLVEGKFFDGTVEDKASIILNETAVREFCLSDALGKQVVMHNEPLKIIGIVRDFYYSSHSGDKILPLALTRYSPWVDVMYLKMRGEFSIRQKIEVTEILRQFNPEYILSSYNLADSYASKFQKEDRFLTMLLLGTMLAIFLSFMGMFALSAYNADSRTKEIGIRKVVGSSTMQVVFRMLTGSLKWVLLAMPLAFLAAYLTLDYWLSGFANRVTLSPLYFLAGGLAALVIASLAVFLKSWQAARQNPVESLRSE
jgi:putative ABC transport system permease protein